MNICCIVVHLENIDLNATAVSAAGWMAAAAAALLTGKGWK